MRVFTIRHADRPAGELVARLASRDALVAALSPISLTRDGILRLCGACVT
jgi:hypothetical protein